jgi:hypothetical protein
MPLPGEPPRDQTAAKAAAEHREIGLCGSVHRVRSGSMQPAKAKRHAPHAT